MGSPVLGIPKSPQILLVDFLHAHNCILVAAFLRQLFMVFSRESDIPPGLDIPRMRFYKHSGQCPQWEIALRNNVGKALLEAKLGS